MIPVVFFALGAANLAFVDDLAGHQYTRNLCVRCTGSPASLLSLIQPCRMRFLATLGETSMILPWGVLRTISIV